MSLPEVIYCDTELCLRRVPGQGKRLVVVFGGANVPKNKRLPFEFLKVASHNGRNHLLGVQDMMCTWFTRPGLITRIVAAIEAEATRVEAEEVIAIGNSMGGFAALIFPAFTPIARSLAINPQVSMDPSVIEETRFDEYRDAFGPDYPVSNAADLIGTVDTQFTVLFGASNEADTVHADLLRPSDNLLLSNKALTGHGLAKIIRQFNMMDPLVRSVMYDHPRRLVSVVNKIESRLGQNGWRADLNRATVE